MNAAYPDKFRNDIERRVRARKIDVILGDAVEDLTESVTGLTTNNGKSIPDADLVVCFPHMSHDFTSHFHVSRFERSASHRTRRL